MNDVISWGSYLNMVFSGDFVPKPPLILSKITEWILFGALQPVHRCWQIYISGNQDLFSCFASLCCLNQGDLFFHFCFRKHAVGKSLISNCSQNVCLKTEQLPV